jgi:ABC-2 type transport system ATP-binding protein
MRTVNETASILCENDYNASEVLRFVAERNISLLKWEREEPSLESLFMEVSQK